MASSTDSGIEVPGAAGPSLLSRRTIVRTMAWSVPIIAVGTAAPAFADGSAPSYSVEAIAWTYCEAHQSGGSGNGPYFFVAATGDPSQFPTPAATYFKVSVPDASPYGGYGLRLTGASALSVSDIKQIYMLFDYGVDLGTMTEYDGSSTAWTISHTTGSSVYRFDYDLASGGLTKSGDVISVTDVKFAYKTANINQTWSNLTYKSERHIVIDDGSIDGLDIKLNLGPSILADTITIA